MKDKSLYVVRGLTMMYIVCVIHLLYWTNFFPYPITKSLFLFEMPMIFFISGVSYVYSKTKSSYFSYWIGRLKRVVSPYYFFVLVLWLILLTYNILIKDSFDLSLKFWIDSLLLNFPYSSAIWFIKVYLIILLLAPLLMCFYKKIKNITCILLAFLLLLWVLQFYGLPYRNIVCYSFFFILGIDAKTSNWLENLKLKYVAPMLLISAVVFTIFVLSGASVDLQQNKFPPTILFFCYGTFLLIATIILVWKRCVILCKIKIFKWLIDVYSKHGYDIFLFQIISFFPFRLLQGKLSITGINSTFSVENIPLLTYVLFIIASFLYLLFSNAIFIVAIEKIKDFFLKLLKNLKLN